MDTSSTWPPQRTTTTNTGGGGMTEEEQAERRASIREIMEDESLTPLERRQSIQSLMDGRTSASCAGPMSMAAAAAAVAAEFDSDDDDESLTDDDHDDTPSTWFPPSHFSARRVTTRRSASFAAMSGTTQQQHHENTSQHMEQSRPPCHHYQRQCTIVSPCCGLAFGCRLCHDESPILPDISTTPNCGNEQPRRRNSLPANLHHEMDRFAIQQVICRNCYTKQDCKTNECISCHVQFGEYHCAVCNLWMSADEDPYHCQDCGCCRVGGKGNYRHCHDCGTCIFINKFEQHSCKPYSSQCPVCLQDLFQSRAASHEMPCGHLIHWHCFQEMQSYKCPLCKKTARQMNWESLAKDIELRPVPPEMARLVTVTCNDCESRQDNRQWHFLGVQCQECHSFNTNVENTILVGAQAAAAVVNGSMNSSVEHSVISVASHLNVQHMDTDSSTPPIAMEED